MNLIVGLGNPGEKYANTRHNAGFMFVDFLYNNSDIVQEWKFDKYANAEIATINLLSNANRQHTTNNLQQTSILAKPQTFMNKSGVSVQRLIMNYQLRITNTLSTTDNQQRTTDNLIVVHDDLDMELGNFKMQKATGPKVHNGLSSIEATIKQNDFWRIRIGVDNRKGEYRVPGETYVLQNFAVEEEKILGELFPKIIERLTINLQNLQ